MVEVVLIQRYEIFLGSPIVTFATVLGALLVCSGFGSLWSGGISPRGTYAALGALLGLLAIHLWWIPALLPLSAGLPLPGKVAVVVGSLAPLAFCMGVPFPFVMRAAQGRLEPAAAALLFALNALPAPSLFP